MLKSVGFVRVTSPPVDFDEQRINSGYDPFVFYEVFIEWFLFRY